MKIAILTSGILPVPAVQGGAVENLIDFYLEYNDRHRLHDITIYSVAHPDALRHKALKSQVNHYHFIDTTSLWAKLRRRLYKARHPQEYYNYFIEYFFEQAYRDICRHDYDCILLENRPGYALKLARRGAPRLVLHLHNDLLNHETPHHDELFSSLSRILTVSDYIKGRVSTIGTDAKVQTVYNGIDLERFSRQPSVSVSRASLGFSADDFVLVFSGRINKDKGIAELIGAMKQLRDQPRIKLMVLGSTFFADAAGEDDFVRMLKREAEDIKDRIVFTGFIPYDQMPSYLQLADASVIPSVWHDPFPTTVLEAQAMGLPVIASGQGGIPEEVSPQSAVIIPMGAAFVSQLAETILDLYQQPEKRRRMGEAALLRSRFYQKERFAHDLFTAITNPIDQ